MSRYSLSPFALLICAATLFAGWIVHDGTRSRTKPEAAPLPLVTHCSMPVQVSESDPFLEPGMPREVVERIVAPAALEATETEVTVDGVPTHRVTYRMCVHASNALPVGPAPEGEWTQLVIDYDASQPTEVVSRVSMAPMVTATDPFDDDDSSE